MTENSTTLGLNQSITDNLAGDNETKVKAEDNIISFQQQDYKKLAIEKLDKERKAMNPSKNSAVGIMYIETANALINFCEQSKLFAEVLYKTKRSFADCMDVVAKNPGSGISDIDAYRRAVQFYFPNSQIEFLMNITLGEAPDDKYITKESKKKEKPAKSKVVQKKEKQETKQKNKAKPVLKKKEPEPKNIQLSLF